MAPRFLVLLAPISGHAVLHLQCCPCLSLCDLSVSTVPCRLLVYRAAEYNRVASPRSVFVFFSFILDQALTHVDESTSHRPKLLMTMRVISVFGLFPTIAPVFVVNFVLDSLPLYSGGLLFLLFVSSSFPTFAMTLPSGYFCSTSTNRLRLLAVACSSQVVLLSRPSSSHALWIPFGFDLEL
jgi:hypothetical protein